MEDERLCKCVILGGSTTVGTRANNGLRVHHSFSKLKNLTNKSFAKSRNGLSRMAALVLSNQFSVGTLTYVA